MFKGNNNEHSSAVLSFTFWYAVVIYIFAISFYFWLWRTDIKPEEKEFPRFHHAFDFRFP